jgi:hypothetical protein
MGLRRFWKEIRANVFWDAIKWLWAAGGTVIAYLVQWLAGHTDLATTLITWSAVVFFVATAIYIYRHPHLPARPMPQPLPAEQQDAAAPQMPALNEDQLARLTEYERFAIRLLIEAGGYMTGRQLYGRMIDWGFPIATRAGQNEIMLTFERINQKTTLLTKEPFSNVWSLRQTS